jgi:hypothetical protein
MRLSEPTPAKVRRSYSTYVEQLIRGIKGFVSYSLVRMEDGGFSVSVFQDKAGSDESVRVARDYISKNAGNTGAPPKVSEGSVILQAK